MKRESLQFKWALEAINVHCLDQSHWTKAGEPAIVLPCGCHFSHYRKSHSERLRLEWFSGDHLVHSTAQAGLARAGCPGLWLQGWKFHNFSGQHDPVCLITFTVKQFSFLCSSVISCISVCSHCLLVTNLDKLLTCSNISAEAIFFPACTPNLLFDCWTCWFHLFFEAPDL